MRTSTWLRLMLVTAAFTAPTPTQEPAAGSPRLVTDRAAGRELLRLPKEEDTFGFVVFGDRTGGPKEGIEVLAQAVADTNLLDPDLVMTVGDLVQGYNAHDAWMEQAAEFKGVMARLRMPWFPVAGNHDIYWRGKERPAGEHERDYETVFGPLWYAVQHKRCWFVVLYSDEGNPETGEKNFQKPDCQRISEEQFAWLGATLEKARDARHVFVFLHHPRWLKRYGDDWQRVHTLLADNGNVTAVFAGHIHQMQFDGVRDGIEYHTVASVGAHLGMEAPEAGFLHQYHVVTVRPEGIVVAALPVGTVLDPRQFSADVADDALLVHKNLQPKMTAANGIGDAPAVSLRGEVDALVTIGCHNAGKRAIELELIPDGRAPWRFSPDHQHLVVPPGGDATTTFAVRRAATVEPFALPDVEVRCDYLASDRRIPLPARTMALELPAPPGFGEQDAEHPGVLVLDGESALRVVDRALALPDGPLTLECWLEGTDFAGRRGLVTKTENSEFGIFCSDAKPSFSVHLGGRYVVAETDRAALQAGRWHHVAGVFDGQQVRLYLDGELLAHKAGSGVRTNNELPLLIGADVDGRGQATSHFEGRIDDVRLSRVARYTGARFEPPARHLPDDDTALLLPCDVGFGPWTPDRSPAHAHALRLGNAHCTLARRR